MMRITQLAAALVTVIGLSAIATPAMAYDAGDWLIRGRIINVDPNDDSGGLRVAGTGDIGKGVTVDSDTVPEIDITYMFARNWGTELILGYSKHTISGEKALSSLGNVINTKVLPPTLTLQYHFMPDNNIRPYVGAGINYTYFFDDDVVGQALPQPEAHVKLDSSWGLAAQAGVDIALDKYWFVNMDVKYIDMSTTASFRNTAAGDAKINVDINPFVWGIGIGRRF